jgi:hypothetical protein
MSKPVTANVKPQKFNDCLRAFFVSHPVGIKLSIFLILFVTFVAREGIRDYFKDRTSTIDNARSTAMILTEVASSGNEHAHIIETLSTIQTAVIPSQMGLDSEHNAVGRQALACSLRLFEVNYILRSLRMLHDRAELSEELLQENNRLTLEHAAITQRLNEFYEPLTNEQPVDNAKLLAVVKDSMELLRKAVTLQGQMLVQAEKDRKVNEHWLKYISIVAYAFYGVGAVLTVLSITYKVGEPSAAGE